jgi:hypothetical protein
MLAWAMSGASLGPVGLSGPRCLDQSVVVIHQLRAALAGVVTGHRDGGMLVADLLSRHADRYRLPGGRLVDGAELGREWLGRRPRHAPPARGSAIFCW